MPLTVELWNELTNSTVEAQVIRATLPHDTATNNRFQLLKWVDPWGDTVFNQAQCSDLVAELAFTIKHFDDSNSANAKALAEVKALAERTSAEPHLYLVFIGD